MIIVDTSIWIEFLKGGFEHSSYFVKLIENREILLLECIVSELLQGVKNRREKEIILLYWKLLPKISMDSLWIEAGIYSSENKLFSKGIGIIDAVIMVSAQKTESRIWTLDKKILNSLDKSFIFIK